MKKTVAISVIIPAYNEEKYVSSCLEALKKQRTNIPYEIIVVDNGSMDATATIAKSFDVTIVREPKKGYSRAIVSGIKKAKGTFIALIDADTIVPPQWVGRVHETFRSHPDAICIGGPAIFYDGSAFIIKIFDLLNKTAMFLHIVQPMGFNMAIRKNGKVLNVAARPDIELQWDRYLVNSLKSHGTTIFSPELTVSISSRRWRSPAIIILEASKRFANVLSLAMIKKPIFNSFEDYR